MQRMAPDQATRQKALIDDHVGDLAFYIIDEGKRRKMTRTDPERLPHTVWGRKRQPPLALQRPPYPLKVRPYVTASHHQNEAARLVGDQKALRLRARQGRPRRPTVGSPRRRGMADQPGRVPAGFKPSQNICFRCHHRPRLPIFRRRFNFSLASGDPGGFIRGSPILPGNERA